MAKKKPKEQAGVTQRAPSRAPDKKPRRPRVQSADESMEMLSQWWQDNGRYFIAGAVLGMMAIGGWRGWDYYTVTQESQAATHYEEVLDYIALEDEQDATEILTTLRNEYTNTTYSVFASLAMAKFKVEQEQLEEAAADLRWVAENAQYEELRSLAWVRLARVLMELEQTDEAREIVVNYIFPRGIEELASEIHGDYLTRQGNYEQAKDAYQRAVSTSMVDDYNFIMMKIEEIGGTLEPPQNEDEENEAGEDEG